MLKQEKNVRGKIVKPMPPVASDAVFGIEGRIATKRHKRLKIRLTYL